MKLPEQFAVGIAARLGAECVFILSDRSGYSLYRTLENLPEYFFFLISHQIMILAAGYLLSAAAIYVFSKAIGLKGRVGVLGNICTAAICGIAIGSAIEYYMYYMTGR